MALEHDPEHGLLLEYHRTHSSLNILDCQDEVCLGHTQPTRALMEGGSDAKGNTGVGAARQD